MRSSRILLSCLCLVGLLGGCSTTRTETYDVTIRNGLDRPIMVFLTKDGPPLQEGWWSPEDIATLYGNVEDDLSGMVVQPGRRADSGARNAVLAPGVRAMLRVYEGVHGLPQLLAINRGSTDRLDVVLAQGKTDVTVTRRNGRLTLESDK